MGRIIVWKNLNNNTYYFKHVKGAYRNYQIGLKNQYNHEVILIIELDKFISDRRYKISYRRMLVNDIIRALEKIR